MSHLDECLKILDACLKTLALLGAAVAFAVGLFQYRRAQAWKKAEFLAGEMKDFFENLRVQRALLLIDWGVREIDLLENQPDGHNCVRVTREIQTSALRPHILLGGAGSDPEIFTLNGKAGFDRGEAAIRDCYDAFLDGLERFASYAKSGLIDASSLRPYIGYWIEDIASPTEDLDDAAWCAALLTYVAFYRFNDVLWLFDAFGMNIRPSSSIYLAFLRRMTNQDLASKLAKTVKCDYP